VSAHDCSGRSHGAHNQKASVIGGTLICNGAVFTFQVDPGLSAIRQLEPSADLTSADARIARHLAKSWAAMFEARSMLTKIKLLAFVR
jgi:hypothetical protein